MSTEIAKTESLSLDERMKLFEEFEDHARQSIINREKKKRNVKFLPLQVIRRVLKLNELSILSMQEANYWRDRFPHLRIPMPSNAKPILVTQKLSDLEQAYGK